MKKIVQGWKPGWLIGLLLGLAVAAPGRADVLRTHVDDTLYAADGNAAQGTVLISWPAFTTSSGVTVAKGSTSVTLTGGGELSVSLAPNVGATPANTYYTAVFHMSDGTVSREFWVVPVSAGDVKLDKVRVSVLPTSTAMQTVSKQYVDQAIARAIVMGPLSDPSNPYVEKAGDTMTGPLILPGDPTVPMQASTKNYVDTNVAQLLAGLDQKVSKIPVATQTVVQPANTSLEVNRLNGELNVNMFKSASNAIDGIANTLATPECQASGCEAVIEHGFSSPNEFFSAAAPRRTHGVDHRGGMQQDFFVNPHNPQTGGLDAGEKITVIQTESAAEQKQETGTGTPSSYGLWIDHRGVTGGNNIFPEQITATPPYFKSNFLALNVDGTYNAQGQHVLIAQDNHCYGVGDCLIGSQTLSGTGGFRDSADEGIHPYDLLVTEDRSVFQGVCATGCTTGATQLTVTATRDAGTQGDGRFLIDKAPGKVLSGGTLIGGNPTASPFPTATFSGTNFPLSTLFEITSKILPQATNMAPGTVTAQIVTSGVPAGYSTNTLAAPATTGVACVVDLTPGGSPDPTNYEMANYVVTDGTHIQLTLNKPHNALATISMGGLCGYGVEQTVDTVNDMRQVFPIVGATSPTQIYYAAAHTQLLGVGFSNSGYINQSLTIATIARSGGVVTVTTTSNMPTDLNGLSMTVAGVLDSSYNGTFVMTSIAANQLTYTQAGPNSTSSGGTIGALSGGYNMYPMAEVLSVMNPATQTVDGTMTLAPNNVAWAPNDVVEQPHYYQIRTAGDVLKIWQQMPRPLIRQEAGIEYQNTAGPGLTGWRVNNSAPVSSYLGHGGTHASPDNGLRVTGVWTTSMDLDPGELNAFHLACKPGGCNRWNSAYNLFSLDSAGGRDYVNYDSNLSKMTFNMRGGQYSFTPTAFTAGTINATTINATTVNGVPRATASSEGIVKLAPNAASNTLGSMSTQDASAVNVTGGSMAGLTSVGTNVVNLTTGTTSANGLNFGDANLYRSSAGQTVYNANAAGEIGITVSNLNNGAGADSFFRVQSNNVGNTSFGFYAFGSGRGAGGLIKPLSGYLSTANGMTNGMVIATEANAPIVLGTNGAERVRVQQGLSVGATTDPGAGNILAAGAVISKVQAIAYSAAPVFSVSGNANRIVLTGDVTSSTIGAGADGQRMCMNIVQDATGAHTFAWPFNMLGAMTVGATAGKRNQQCFVYYAADGAWVAESAGVVNQ